MSRDKQIEKMNELEEIARILYEANGDSYDTTYQHDCEILAEVIYNAGYRKSTDVAEEIFADLDKALGELAMKYSGEGLNQYFGVCEVVFRKVLYPIKKKYIGKDINVTTKDTEGRE